MGKPRTKAFRRNRRRNTRKIKGGDLNFKQINTYLSRLPAYLEETVDDETKMKVANTLFSEVFKIINSKISREEGGYLVEAQYIIHRKLRKRACGRFAERKTLGRVFKRSTDCEKEIADMEALKRNNEVKLEKRIRRTLKGAKELSSRFLATVLMSMMQKYSASESVLAQKVLKMYFTNELITFKPDESIKLEEVLTEKYTPEKMSTTEKADTEKAVDELLTKEGPETAASVVPESQYEKFKSIVGENTLSKTEFDLLVSIYNSEKGGIYGGGFTDLPELILTIVVFAVVFSEGVVEAVVVNFFRAIIGNDIHEVDVGKRTDTGVKVTKKFLRRLF
jgi:hypothetical protein